MSFTPYLAHLDSWLNMSTCLVLQENNLWPIFSNIFFLCIRQEHERVTIFLDIIPMSLTIISMSYLTCDLKLKVTSLMRLLMCWTIFWQLTTIHDLRWENHCKTYFSPLHGEKVMLHFVWPLRRRNKHCWVQWQVKNLATIPVWSWILFTERSLLTRLLK